ncbi:MAG TPA: hypothetical protein VFH03_07390 [Actinoplanes sp.]|nr:hypothetical protein [Actinoplanes sp.]
MTSISRNSTSAAGYAVDGALLTFLRRVLGRVAGLPTVGDDVQAAVMDDRVGEEPAGGGIEFDVVDAQTRGAGGPGDQRHGDDAGDEQARDGDAVGLLHDVLDQRVRQHGGEQS